MVASVFWDVGGILMIANNRRVGELNSKGVDFKMPLRTRRLRFTGGAHNLEGFDGLP